jgi:hypothetical protein
MFDTVPYNTVLPSDSHRSNCRRNLACLIIRIDVHRAATAYRGGVRSFFRARRLRSATFLHACVAYLSLGACGSGCTVRPQPQAQGCGLLAMLSFKPQLMCPGSSLLLSAPDHRTGFIAEKLATWPDQKYCALAQRSCSSLITIACRLFRTACEHDAIRCAVSALAKHCIQLRPRRS